jgi:hypothetical protein
MASNNLPPIPQDEIKENPRWREWFRNLGNYIQAAQVGNVVWTILQGGTGAPTAAGARANLGLGSMAIQNSSSVAVTGGTISGVAITNSTIPWSDVITQPHVEAYDLTTTITVNNTPTVLAPANTVAGSSGITYNSSTGVFTFADAGSYGLSLAVNALASSANQFLYIYAENWNGSAWVVNANSGKYYTLTNGTTVQILYSQSVYRTAGQQVRYKIYSNGTNTSLKTQTLPSVTGVYVPAIRIQYS